MRDGYVYFIRSTKGGPVKIGWATNPADRLRDLQAANGERLELLAVTPGTISDERALHREFAYARVRGEWFAYRSTLQRLVRQIRAEWGEPVAGFALPTRLQNGSQSFSGAVPVRSGSST